MAQGAALVSAEGQSQSSRATHAAGLAIAAVAAACLAMAWVYGLPLLDGTQLEDLAYVVFAGVAAVVLAVADAAAKLLPADVHDN